VTYQLSDVKAEHQIFRAHEVAHQWWGIGVDFKTYHDQWLSEGFAQYSGLCYAQVMLQDNDVFFEILESYRDAIVNNRSYLFSSGQEGGPIWLGHRTNTSETSGDYGLMIYRKGAWVLHMLRNMMLDLKTMDESRFNGLMREFYQTYKGKKASTADFIRLTEKYMRKDMDWFFDQWIYGTDIPLYKFSYSSKKAGNGSYLIQCKVVQENVPENFQMDVPVLLVLPENKFARFRVNVKGRITMFSLPPLPMEPIEIIFNDLQSVLCEVEYDSE
jgi:aminopeptidase N